MPSNNVFRWLEGSGWLILSGGADEEIRALALGRVAADGGIAYVVMRSAPEAAERAMEALEDLEDLGAPSGFIVNVTTEDDQTIQSKLMDAAMILVESAPSTAEARSVLIGAAADGIQAAYEQGAIVLFEGTSAGAVGAWVVLDDARHTNGLEWLEGALVAPGVVSIAESEQARAVLALQPAAIVVGIGTGSALALGAEGQVEIWGQRQVTVALGGRYTPKSGESDT